MFWTCWTRKWFVSGQAGVSEKKLHPAAGAAEAANSFAMGTTDRIGTRPAIFRALILIPQPREKDLLHTRWSRRLAFVLQASIARWLGASRTGISLGMTAQDRSAKGRIRGRE